MKQVIQKIFVRSLVCAFAVGLFCIPRFAFAQSDLVITNFLAIDPNPAPNEQVDFTVVYANGGSSMANAVELVLDYNETQLSNISVGDPTNCTDNGVAILCYFDEVAGQSSFTTGFTAAVIPSVKQGTEVVTTAFIEEIGNVNEDQSNNYSSVPITISGIKAGSLISLPAEFGLTGQVVELEKPSENQGLALFDVKDNPNWQASKFTTAALKFMIRGKEALAWSLGITDAGFHNPAIRSSYLKVLTVVNSLFIIGLLVIAAMWIFSIVIPRKYLRQVVLIYGAAVVFVNFALPLNQLFIDGTSLLQNTFLKGMHIANIVDTPIYNDENAVGYTNKSQMLKQSASKKFNLNLALIPAENEVGDSEIVIPPSDIVIGEIDQSIPNELAPDYTGRIDTPDGSETIQLHSNVSHQLLRLNADQSFELTDETIFNPNEEYSIFAFLMILFTGLAYLGMALIFILRIVILWAMMIVSPMLFLLAIFRATRSYFFNWLGIYARWLFIGPLMALGISIVVNIWQTVGLPITSSYPGLGEFGALTNIGFFLPGKNVINNLSTTPQMMEYLLFLIMLYLPIFFAFMLTRQKTLSAAATTIVEKHGASRVRKTTTTEAGAAAVGTEKPAEKVVAGAKAVASGIKGLLGSKFAEVTKAGMPSSMRSAEPRTAAHIETAHSLLPEHLALRKMGDVLDIAAGSEGKGSRNVHAKAIKNLASPNDIPDSGERKKVMAVRNEISERAAKGDAEAVNVLNEIHEQERIIETSAPAGAPMGVPIMEGEVHAAAPEVMPVVIRDEIEKDSGMSVSLKSEVSDKKKEEIQPAKPKTDEEAETEDEEVKDESLDAAQDDNEESDKKEKGLKGEDKKSRSKKKQKAKTQNSASQQKNNKNKND